MEWAPRAYKYAEENMQGLPATEEGWKPVYNFCQKSPANESNDSRDWKFNLAQFLSLSSLLFTPTPAIFAIRQKSSFNFHLY